MGSRIYDRPDLDQRRHLLALYVTGSLPATAPLVAYRGTLQIVNQVGACTVEQIDGDALPPGSSLYVEGTQVVITWPAYQETGVVPIFNGNFELGDEGWLKGAGWTIENSGGDNDGHGAKVAVYQGQGESLMEAVNFYPCTQGHQFTAALDVQQGASSANNCGGGVGVRYYDAAQVLIGEERGNMVWSGNNGQWHMSTMEGHPPVGTAFARPICIGNRRRERKRMWVDDGSWTLQAVVGINYATVIDLTLRIRDSAGRSVIWTGAIQVTVDTFAKFDPLASTTQVTLDASMMVATADASLDPVKPRDNAWIKTTHFKPLIGPAKRWAVEIHVIALSAAPYFHIGLCTQAWAFYPAAFSAYNADPPHRSYRSNGDEMYSGFTDGSHPYGVGDVMGIVLIQGPAEGSCQFYKNGVAVGDPMPFGPTDTQPVSPIFGALYASCTAELRTDPALMTYFANYAADGGWSIND